MFDTTNFLLLCLIDLCELLKNYIEWVHDPLNINFKTYVNLRRTKFTNKSLVQLKCKCISNYKICGLNPSTLNYCT